MPTCVNEVRNESRNLWFTVKMITAMLAETFNTFTNDVTIYV
jgi:hypothetical protein